MSQPELTSELGGMEINWRALGSREDRDVTMLAVAEGLGLLEHIATTEESHYALLCNGVHLLLTSDEVPGFVLGVLVAAGRPVDLVPYRLGIKAA